MTPSKSSRLTAQANDREGLIARGVREGARIGLEARVEAIRAFRRLRDPEALARLVVSIAEQAKPILVEATVAAHLAGEARAIANTPDQRKRVRFDRLPFDTIIEKLADKLDVSPTREAEIRAKYAGPAVESMNLMVNDLAERLKAAARQAIETNAHTAEGIRLLREAFTASGWEPRANYQIEAVFRTAANTAYSAGRWSKNQEPEIREILWGYEFVTAGDDRVRPEHQALDGLRMPVEDPRWRDVMPPVPSSPWNCRCDVVEIYREESELAAVSIPAGAFDGLIGVGVGSPFGSAVA